MTLPFFLLDCRLSVCMWGCFFFYFPISLDSHVLTKSLFLIFLPRCVLQVRELEAAGRIVRPETKRRAIMHSIRMSS